MLDNKNVAKKHIGTFLRLGKYIDFSNHRQLIKEEIASKLNKWESHHHHVIFLSYNHDTEGITSNFCLPRKGS
jgi:hypothetical protein